MIKTEEKKAKIKISEYPELRKISWFYNEKEIEEESALRIYERNWFYLNERQMFNKEKELVKYLALKFNGCEMLNTL